VIIVGKRRLYGTSEIADRLGVTRQRAHVVTRQKGFPEPYEELIMGSVWLVEDVEAWIREHRPEVAEEPEGS
jgi:prophage regulatory protein